MLLIRAEGKTFVKNQMDRLINLKNCLPDR